MIFVLIFILILIFICFFVNINIYVSYFKKLDIRLKIGKLLSFKLPFKNSSNNSSLDIKGFLKMFKVRKFSIISYVNYSSNLYVMLALFINNIIKNTIEDVFLKVDNSSYLVSYMKYGTISIEIDAVISIKGYQLIKYFLRVLYG